MNPQLDLFRDPAPAAVANGERETSNAQERLAALANRLPASLRLGASSWAPASQEDGEDPRLPPDRDVPGGGLQAYARHPLLRTVGLDTTFYAPIPESDFRRHAQLVPADFRFVVKAPQSLTAAYLFEAREPSAHFLDARAAIDLFIGPCLAGLGPAAGPLVFQFPPQGRKATCDPSRFAARLARFLGGLPRGPLYAVELRDRALLGPETMRALADANARLCLAVHARMPAVAVQAAAATSLGTGSLVLRWYLHASPGHRQPTSGTGPRNRLVEEDPATRAAIAALVRERIALGEEAWVIAQGDALEPAARTLERLACAILPEAR